MTAPSPIIAGVFEQESQARRALSALKQSGFGYDQVGVVSPHKGASDLLHDFLNLGLPREQALFYDQQFRLGYAVVSVRPDGREQEARAILQSNGAFDYDQHTPATHRQDRQAVPTQEATGALASPNDEDAYHRPRSLKLREERLDVNKENVQTGEVQVHKDVVTEQKVIEVPVTHEEVTIERRAIPAGRLATNIIGEDEIIRIPVLAEEISIAKTAVITEEVKVGKQVVQETQQVSDSIRREEARVEKQGNVRLQADPMNAEDM